MMATKRELKTKHELDEAWLVFRVRTHLDVYMFLRQTTYYCCSNIRSSDSVTGWSS
jgi:hypothetical protein